MNQTLRPSRETPAAACGRDLARVASAIRSEWRAGMPPNAAAALAADTQLAADRPLAIDLAYEEFCLREQAGETIDPMAFADRFPFATSLFRLIQIHGLLNHHPDLIPAGRPAIQHNPGDRLGDYEIVRPLGQGGFADVYLAKEFSAGGRGVVLKLSARNEHEADTLGPLSHPHLMSVYSAPNINGLRAVVMPFFGVTTAERLVTALGAARRRISGREFLHLTTAESLPGDPPVSPSPPFGVRPNDPYPTTVRALARGVAAALAFLHARGVAHRDIKPANILLGTTGHPYLLDFNLAIDSTGGERIGGTLPYLAPEVLAVLSNDTSDSATTIDWHTADVFSFGVVMWELLTGRHPYLTGVPLRTVSGQMRQAGVVVERQDQFLRGASARRFQYRGAMWRLIERCLAPDPAGRPTAAELQKAFAPKSRRFPVLITTATMGIGLVGGGYLASGLFLKPNSQIGQAQPKDDFALGVQFYQEGKLSLAADAFVKAGQAKNDPQAYTCGAYCYARLEIYPVALDLVAQARRLGSDDVSLCLVTAYCQLHSEQPNSARNECDRALLADPDCHSARLIRAYVELRESRQAKRPVARTAVQDFECATSRIPISSDDWITGVKLYLGLRPLNESDEDKAIEAIRRAVQQGMDPDNIRHNPVIHSRLNRHKNYEAALAESRVNASIIGQPLLGHPPF